jgi:hypothetical protein
MTPGDTHLFEVLMRRYNQRLYRGVSVVLENDANGALCHSSVDDSFTKGIGRRMDGWANTDLNVGAIVALSPVLDDATKAEFNDWGPGKYDPRHHAFDGTSIIPLNSPSLPIVIPPIYGREVWVSRRSQPTAPSRTGTCGPRLPH